MKLLAAVPVEGMPPLTDFFGDLDEQQSQKPLTLFSFT